VPYAALDALRCGVLLNLPVSAVGNRTAHRLTGWLRHQRAAQAAALQAGAAVLRIRWRQRVAASGAVTRPRISYLNRNINMRRQPAGDAACGCGGARVAALAFPRHRRRMAGLIAATLDARQRRRFAARCAPRLAPRLRCRRATGERTYGGASTCSSRTAALLPSRGRHLLQHACHLRVQRSAGLTPAAQPRSVLFCWRASRASAGSVLARRGGFASIALRGSSHGFFGNLRRSRAVFCCRNAWRCVTL